MYQQVASALRSMSFIFYSAKCGNQAKSEPTGSSLECIFFNDL